MNSSNVKSRLVLQSIVVSNVFNDPTCPPLDVFASFSAGTAAAVLFVAASSIVNLPAPTKSEVGSPVASRFRYFRS